MAEPEIAGAAAWVLEVDHQQRPGQGRRVAGEVFLSRRLDEGGRVVSVLADAAGQGVEASVVAHACAAMALEIVAWNIDTARAADLLMSSLPTGSGNPCAFTLVEVHSDGRTRIFVHGNPAPVRVRGGATVSYPVSSRSLPRWQGRVLEVSECRCEPGDRLGLWSAGLLQGGDACGWGLAGIQDFLCDTLTRHPDLSARRLAERLLERSLLRSASEGTEDLTCGLIHLREPRVLHVLTGPPFDARRDGTFAGLLRLPGARKVICGGTTAQLVARELKRPLMSEGSPGEPLGGRLEGADLVTEGCLTLAHLEDLLACGESGGGSAAGQLLDLLLESDFIHFHVGTRVNEAHLDPELPVELDIRRNVVKRLGALLERKHLKQTCITYY